MLSTLSDVMAPLAGMIDAVEEVGNSANAVAEFLKEKRNRAPRRGEVRGALYAMQPKTGEGLDCSAGRLTPHKFRDRNAVSTRTWRKWFHH
jgi:hypothetical protein